jgi:hypothetical protein
MRQRGRKPASIVTFPVIEAPRPPLNPPPGLTKAEQSLFTEIFDNAQHLMPTDAPLLASYVQAAIASRRSARDPSKADLWEKATRLQAMLATKLRLTAQSRCDPKKLGRQDPPPGQAPWED